MAPIHKWKLSILEARILDQVPIDNLYGNTISIKLGINFQIRLGLKFNPFGTNSAMTRVLVLSAKVTRNEWLK